MTLEEMLNHILKNTQERAVKYNRICTITYDDLMTLWNKQSGLCAISGYNMDTTIGSNYKVSIDRIDSSMGYTNNNIQLVCRISNRAKSNIPYSEFIALCKAIAKNNA